VEEWEDDVASMRYGDWESDEQEMQAYPRPGIEPAHGANRSLIVPELSSGLEARPYLVPSPRDLPVPPPMPQPPPREVQHYQQRTTQPLHPRSPLRMSQDRPSEVPPPRVARPTRQLIPSEQAKQSIPAPYTVSTQVCRTCKGAGYLRADVPYGHPNFGKPIACECKEAERKEKRRWQLQEISNLGDLKYKNFENFRPNISRTVYEAYQVALDYARDPQGWFVLIGKNGCGKTHLAAAIANRCLARGSLVLFSTVIDLLEHLRATFVPTSTEVYDQLFAKMREAELLVLDDLGAQQSSPWANEKLFQLLNYRYNSQFPTIITTNNLGLQGIEERIRSRMTDASLVTIVTFDGAQDHRPHNPRRG
jgi:DNA replication protein DnaC